MLLQARSDQSVGHLLRSPEFSLLLDQLRSGQAPSQHGTSRFGDQAQEQEQEQEQELQEELDESEASASASSVGTALGVGAKLARELEQQRLESVGEVQASMNRVFAGLLP